MGVRLATQQVSKRLVAGLGFSKSLPDALGSIAPTPSQLVGGELDLAIAAELLELDPDAVEWMAMGAHTPENATPREHIPSAPPRNGAWSRRHSQVKFEAMSEVLHSLADLQPVHSHIPAAQVKWLAS